MVDHKLIHLLVEDVTQSVEKLTGWRREVWNRSEPFNLVPRVYSAFKMAAGHGEEPGTRWRNTQRIVDTRDTRSKLVFSTLDQRLSSQYGVWNTKGILMIRNFNTDL